jgi:hypothetical protein
METKVCYICKKEKSLDEFYNSKRNGKRYECKECSRERVVKYRIENPDKISEKQKKWWKSNWNKKKKYRENYKETHREEINERAKKYRMNNFEQVKKTNREQYEKNREKMISAVRKYRLKNIELVKIRNSLYQKKNIEKYRILKKRLRHELNDSYVVRLIKTSTGINKDEIYSWPHLIKLKRTNVLLKREIKQQQDISSQIKIKPNDKD